MKIVKLAKGLVAGLEEDDHILYKGIPYASPPVGKLRFRPPKEESAWDGVYMADHFPNRSWQTDQEEGSFYEKEFYSQKKYNTPYR